MISVNNYLVYSLHCQQQTQYDRTCALQVIQQSQRDHANDSLINDIPSFDGKPELYFYWILKFKNIAVVTK